MIIVISPSKTYQTERQAPLQIEKPSYEQKANDIRQQLKTWSREDFQQRMKLSDALTDQVTELYHGKTQGEGNTAITYYTGLVYKQLCLSLYDEAEWAYIKDHVRILSAMYGLLKPQDGVMPYRLDFLVRWPGMNLYKYWKEAMVHAWENETIIDLSSKEFGKMLPDNRIQIQFLQRNKKGEWKAQSTKTKMARGKMLNWMIQNQVQRPEEIQSFDLEGYRFDEQRSSKEVWFFVQENQN